jgi:hypothetical protein
VSASPYRSPPEHPEAPVQLGPVSFWQRLRHVLIGVCDWKIEINPSVRYMVVPALDGAAWLLWVQPQHIWHGFRGTCRVCGKSLDVECAWRISTGRLDVEKGRWWDANGVMKRIYAFDMRVRTYDFYVDGAKSRTPLVLRDKWYDIDQKYFPVLSFLAPDCPVCGAVPGERCDAGLHS